MRKLLLALLILVAFCMPVKAETVLVKAFAVSQLATDETPISLWSNNNAKSSAVLTNKNIFLLTDPSAANALFVVEKITIPAFETNEQIADFLFNAETQKVGAMVTNKYIYLIKTK